MTERSDNIETGILLAKERLQNLENIGLLTKERLQSLENIGLLSKERLQNIERKIDTNIDHKLDDILEKLGSKSDKLELSNLEIRVRNIETYGSITSQNLVDDVKNLREETDKQASELIESHSKLKSTIAYIMGATAAIVVIIEMYLKK